jgi:selenocysteine lyase/cysteine desulfurase
MGLKLDFDYLRSQLVGADAAIMTPFGERLMVYADYTASGRCVSAIESYIQGLQRIYANSHTEDDISGRSMTHLLEQAEASIKRSVNAGTHERIVCVGTGATGAIDKLQQIIGVALPPHTRERFTNLIEESLGADALVRFEKSLQSHQPVVFVGPYEHHSNEISWRQSLATVVEVGLDDDGGIDLSHLETLLQDPAYQNRIRIGSFSAASNVTGRISPVHEIAAMLHRHGAIACFDYAASAPYVEIDMNPAKGRYEGDASIDAVFISPHKFLGGPGSSGVLVFKDHLYRRDLPPTVSAGGTVDYVGLTSQDYISAVEEREKAGTPGVLQVMKAALAFQLKDEVGLDAIEAREHELLSRTFVRLKANSAVEILGSQDPTQRIAIVSFNIKGRHGRYLHPKYVTRLLNDLFGIQSRAGCSCAGPYGHRLLDIDEATSEDYRAWIRRGYSGIKPGWCRISLHYVMDDVEVDYILDAIEFVAENGSRLLDFYDFDVCSGNWTHKQDDVELPSLSISEAVEQSSAPAPVLDAEERQQLYQSFLAEARRLADEAMSDDSINEVELSGDVEKLRFFELPH